MKQLEYPHLSDTDFPEVEEVNVYKYENNFDYSRWTDNVRIKLLDVPWESDGSNVVKFDDDVARDKWFDTHEGESVEIKTPFHVMPQQYLRVPLPYPTAMTYNYAMIETPVMTSDGQPLEFENAARRYERTFWFIMDVRELAPNTTELLIQQDYWTNYINHVDISWMMLRRGHAPLRQISATEYLKDPYHNKQWLLAEDVNFYESTCINSQKFFPFGNGKKYLCFAMNVKIDWFTPAHMAGQGAYNTDATFSDTTEDKLDLPPRTEWNGVHLTGNYQHFVVEGWEWGFDGRRFDNCTVDVRGLNLDSISTETWVYAIDGDDAAAFVEFMRQYYPQWFKCVLCAFDVSGDMFDRGDVITLRAENDRFTVYEVKRADGILGELKFDKNDFRFPTEYEDVAKLYTYPYSFLEITEPTGRSVQVRVEDVTADAVLKFKTSMTFPWFRYSAFFEGVGGDADDAVFSWRCVNKDVENVSIDGSDWAKLLFEHDIPTFGLYQAMEDNWLLDNSGEVDAARDRALKNYRNADDFANTELNNGWRLRQTQCDNEIHASETQESNTLRENTTRQTTGNNTEFRRRENAKDNADASFTNSDSTRDANIYARTYERAYADNKRILKGEIENTSRALAAINSVYTLQADVDSASVAVMTTATSAVASGAITGAVAGSVGGGIGTFAGGAIGGGVALGSSVLSGLSSYVAMGNDTTLCRQMNANQIDYFNDMYGGLSGAPDFPDSYNLAKGSYTFGSDTSLVGRDVELDKDVITQRTTKENNLIRAVMYTNRNVVKGGYAKNFDNSNGQSFTGTAIRTYNTEVQNNADWKTCYDQNAEDLQDRRETNAEELCTALKQNDACTQNSRTRQAKRDMFQAREDFDAGFENAKHGDPIQRGSYTGDAVSDVYRWRGVQVKVRTQPLGAIHQAGDQMLRYGYYLNQTWEFEGFNLMEHFTYWKCDDIWLTGGTKGVPEDGQENIKRILKNGVTVWHNPDDFGKYSIYENM